MPTSYTGRETDDEETPDQERAQPRKPMQPMQAGQPAQAYVGRTFQPPQMPGGTPGQTSPMPWTAQLGGAGRAETTPWAQSLGGNMGAGAGMQVMNTPEQNRANVAAGGMLQTIPGQWDDDNARAAGGGGPNWAALKARFGGGAPMGQPPVQMGGGTQQQSPMAGGNPWLQQMLSGLAQRFAGLQRGGGAPQGQGSAQPSSRLWQGLGRR